MGRQVTSFLRFAGAEIDHVSQVSVGIFTVAYGLRNGGTLPEYDHERVVDLLHWFGEHLEEPHRFSRSKRPRQNRAVCWFRPTAALHLSKIRELVAVLEHNDAPIKMIKAARVGYVVYEDEFQIVAEPFADTNLF